MAQPAIRPTPSAAPRARLAGAHLLSSLVLPASPHLALPLFPLGWKQPQSRPLGYHPISPFSGLIFLSPQVSACTPAGPPMSPLTLFQGHSHQPAADAGLPPSCRNPRLQLRESRLPPRLVPSPGLSSSMDPGSWIPGQHPRWFPVLWSLCWSPSFTPKKGN